MPSFNYENPQNSNTSNDKQSSGNPETNGKPPASPAVSIDDSQLPDPTPSLMQRSTAPSTKAASSQSLGEPVDLSEEIQEQLSGPLASKVLKGKASGEQAQGRQSRPSHGDDDADASADMDARPRSRHRPNHGDDGDDASADMDARPRSRHRPNHGDDDADASADMDAKHQLRQPRPNGRSRGDKPRNHRPRSSSREQKQRAPAHAPRAPKGFFARIWQSILVALGLAKAPSSHSGRGKQGNRARRDQRGGSRQGNSRRSNQRNSRSNSNRPRRPRRNSRNQNASDTRSPQREQNSR